MLSIKNIWTVTRYEVKTLLRSWFFRIFAGLVLIVLTFFNVVFFAQAFEKMPWLMRGVPSSIPYFNMILLNVAQAIIAIFLASDFLKRDRKSNTTEVIYMRNMSNADYILGKTIGLFNVFLGLNVLMLFIAALIQIIFTDVPIQPLNYLNYLLLISIPTLVFIFGLAFVVMSLVRNQAITFIVLLGYFAVSLVVLNTKLMATFDAVAFFLPLSFSDFVGFSNLTLVLVQRLAYLSIGLGFIFLSILLFKRLPQSKTMQMLSVILTVVFLAVGSVLFATYLIDARSGDTLRADMIKLNDENAAEPIVSVLSYNIDFEQGDNTFAATAELNVANESGTAIDKMIFTLNPGLLIEAIKYNDQSVNFERDLHLFKIDAPLAVGENGTLVISYGGSIDNRAFYLSTPKEERDKLHELMVYKRGKEHSFVEPNFVLLTPEANWYPLAGASQGTDLVSPRLKFFADFQLNVKAKDGLTAISQGEGVEADGQISFMPKVPLTQLSLTIGEYQKRSITVDSVTYNLYTHPEHDFFVEHVSAITDTLEALIRDLKNEYELKTKIDYPFSSYSIVEAPIHFKTFEKPLSFHQDWVQPMITFLPENGAPVDAVDFARHLERSLDRMEDRNETISETEMQYNIVRRFIQNDLLGSSMRRPWERGDGENLYSIFPNFYHFCNALVSEDLPILDRALEAYLKDKAEAMPFNPARFSDAITDEEQANIALKDSSLQDILANPDNSDMATTVLKMKSNYLFRYLESQMGIEELDIFLVDLRKENQFNAIKSDDFVRALEGQFNIDFKKELRTWYGQKEVPGYYFTDIKNYKILDGDRTKYQVLLNIYNPEPVGGVVMLDFFVMGGQGGRGGGFGRFSFSATEYQKALYMAPGEHKRVGFVLNDQPRALTINTLVSRNLPSQSMKRFEDFEENNKAKPIEGVTLLDQPPVLQVEGEYIVDNEDDGFKVDAVQQQSKLKKLLKIENDDDDEYIPFSPWRVPDTWRKAINEMFYGDFAHSAHFIRGGDGDKKVTWEVDLPSSGQYEVYAYNEKIQFRRGRGRGGDEMAKSTFYIISHDDGEEEVEFDPESAQGWNYLGTYYFSSGPNKVEMTNKSEGRIVVADAMKWVKK
jgi:ABC-type transport system involved in multi-copper enzyme maturation permease subunit